LRGPKREAVVESTRILIFKLNRPGRASVLRLVDTKLSWIPRRSYGQQIGDVGTKGLYIAKLQRFGARDDSGSPRLTAVSSDGEGAGATARPDHSRVDRPHRDQTVGRPAVLRSQYGLMKLRRRELLCVKNSAGERRDKKSSELFKHGDSSNGNSRPRPKLAVRSIKFATTTTVYGRLRELRSVIPVE
jgi:hypothetical protein